jgi:hypothetical protein
MTIFISGPDGKPMAFATDAKAEAYRRAQRGTEPVLLQRLRKHCNEVLRLHEQAADALRQRRGRTAALTDIARRLNTLNHAMGDDIRAAEREGKP